MILVLTACGGGQAVAPVGNYRGQAKTPPTVYHVKSGDTLYSISWRYGMDYKTVAKINGIRSPYTIYVGQKLYFKSRSSTSKSQTRTKAATTSQPEKRKKTVTVTPDPRVSANQNLAWRWPADGRIISTYSKTAAGRKGIDIAGRSGQKIIAAADGKVVYSGNGLARYGNLIIIKHNDAYLSAYAHNKTLLVNEGQWVKGGQSIATLGRTGTDREQLHFEIRRNGKPVDPMRFLPKR